MTPQEVINSINKSYEDLKQRARDGNLNESAIYGMVESLARDGARHNAQPQLWREYMPNELMRR